MSLHKTYTNCYESSAVAEMGDRNHKRHGPKRGGTAVLLSRGVSWVPVQHNDAWAKIYFRTKWNLHPFSHLTTTDMGRKIGEELGQGGCVPRREYRQFSLGMAGWA